MRVRFSHARAPAQGSGPVCAMTPSARAGRRRSCGPPPRSGARAGATPARPLVAAPELLLLLRVHADHRFTDRLVRLDLLVDVAELCVPVGVLLAFQGLGGALQAKPVVLQQPAHRGRGHTVSLPRQLSGQVPQRFGRPAQWRHGIPALIRLDQLHQRRNQARINSLRPQPPTAGPPHTPVRQQRRTILELEHTLAHRGLADPGDLRDQPHAPVAEQPRLGRQRKTPVTLVQMWRQNFEPLHQLPTDLGGYSHTTSTSPYTRSNAQFVDGFT